MYKLKSTLIAVLVFATVVGSYAQSVLQVAPPASAKLSASRLQRIDQLVQENVDKKLIAGATALIARDGKIVYNKAFGYSDLEAKAAMRTTDIFRIASQTKAITSVAVM